ncbi:uncharacterized protein [Miscanthus floridulus]|uniref:uncharacterized protein isoform X2 n=1 Tax=Miscanthus floridulus TaxID=154761 RepID=UPI00345A1993
MLPALRLRCRLPVASLRRLLGTPSSSGTGESDLPVDAAAMAAAAAKARAEAAARAQAEAYKQVENFDWSTGADWKTTANILFTVPPKRKEFGKQKRKGKTDEEPEKQKQLEEECAKKDADSKLSKVLDRLDTLEAVVEEIVDDKRKHSSPDLPTKADVAKKDKASPGKASDSKNDSQPVTVKSKDISCGANAPANTAKPNI